jgi:hypothetical protein
LEETMKEYRILNHFVDSPGEWPESLAQEMNTLSQERWAFVALTLGDGRAVGVMARETPHPLFRKS